MKPVRYFSLAILSLILAACASTDQATVDHAALLGDQLTNSGRSDEDKSRDAGRKPAEVLAFLGVQPGMTTMDVMASGGWYTEVLSVAVGPKGKVYAHNLPSFLQFRDGFYDKAISARLADNRLANVIRLDAPMQDTGIEPGSVDVAVTALNLHDIYNNSEDNAVAMLKVLHGLLKSGGVLGVIDHRGDAGADNRALHRMQEAQAIEVAEAAGFEVTSSEILASTEDDHTKMVFAPAIRGKTDRFLLKLTKP